MGKKKQPKPRAFDLQDVPVPPIGAVQDAVQHPKSETDRPVNLEDTIIFDGWL